MTADALTLACRHTVLDRGDRLEIGPACVHVAAGEIVAVHEGEAPPPGWPAVTDLGARLLAPAFVDAHTHLALVGLRGLDVATASAGNVVEDLFYRVERRLTPDDVAALTRVGAYECLLHGTAVVWDHYYHPDGLVRGLDDAGLAGVIGPTLQDLGGPGAHLHDDHLRATVDLHEAGRAVALAPHATDTVSDALWTRLVDAASALGLPIHTHVAQSVDEVRRAVARGRATPLDVLRPWLDADVPWLLVHGLFLTDADLARLDPSRHHLVVCPSSQAQFGFVAPVAAWQAVGLPWLIATDCAATNDSMNLLKELRAVAALRTHDVPATAAHRAWRAGGALRDAEGADAERQRLWAGRAPLGAPEALLRRVWSLPGSLHPRQRCGAIAPGRRAHLVAVDLDHPALWPATDPLRALAYGDVTPAIAGLMIDGRWRTRLGHHQEDLLASGWREARAEADARLRRLLDGL